jgi:hypothetical protein
LNCCSISIYTGLPWGRRGWGSNSRWHFNSVYSFLKFVFLPILRVI